MNNKCYIKRNTRKSFTEKDNARVQIKSRKEKLFQHLPAKPKNNARRPRHNFSSQTGQGTHMIVHLLLTGLISYKHLEVWCHTEL